MKLMGDGPITGQNENSTNLPQLEIVTTVLGHCNIVQNSYQQAIKVLYTFVPDKSFGQLISIHPSSFIELKTADAEFNFTDMRFTDGNNKPLEIEGNVNDTLITILIKL